MITNQVMELLDQVRERLAKEIESVNYRIQGMVLVQCFPLIIYSPLILDGSSIHTYPDFSL